MCALGVLCVQGGVWLSRAFQVPMCAIFIGALKGLRIHVRTSLSLFFFSLSSSSPLSPFPSRTCVYVCTYVDM